MTVTVETSRWGDALVIALAGGLDTVEAEPTERELMGAEEQGGARLVLDLRDLRFIDSTGLSLLINADRRARRAGRKVTFVSGAGASRRILRTVGLDTRLDVVEDMPPAP